VLAAVVYTGLAGFHTSPTLTYDLDPPPLGHDYAYHPAYAGYPHGDPNQPPPAYGPWPEGAQLGSGAWSEGAQAGAGPWPEGGRPGTAGNDQVPVGPSVNGQPHEPPAPARLDLTKPAPGTAADTSAAGVAAAGESAVPPSTRADGTAAAGPAAEAGSAQPAADPSHEDWRSP
jgi:hypothetical protein